VLYNARASAYAAAVARPAAARRGSESGDEGARHAARLRAAWLVAAAKNLKVEKRGAALDEAIDPDRATRGHKREEAEFAAKAGAPTSSSRVAPSV
jgi:hypothetical protein